MNEEEKERLWREQEKARDELKGGTKLILRRSQRNSSEEKEKKKKKKKKERSTSSSESDQERKKKKKKKKNKNKEKSSDSGSSSDEEGDKRKKKDKKRSTSVMSGLEEMDMLKMFSEMKAKKKRGGGEEMFMELMAKMSENYTKIKNANEELNSRCLVLENQNKILKKQVAVFQENGKKV